MRRLNKRVIHHLNERASRLKDGPESGATLVFVAITLIALFALAAFAIDFGLLYSERRDLQNGADAAALAIAEDCARGQCGVAYDEYVTAEAYVDANAHDGTAWAQQVDLSLSERKVTVYNATENADGGHAFNLLFAKVIGFDNFTVGADATVVWGHPRQLATLPIIISECEWNKTNAGWPSGDPANLPDENDVIDDYGAYTRATIEFHDGNATEECAAVAGQDIDGDNKLDGGFGWLKTNGNCEAQVFGVDDGADPPNYGWVPGDPGASPSTGCSASTVEQLLLDLVNRTTGQGSGRTVLIPYFEDIWTGPANGSGPCGSNAKCYKIAGYGAIHVVGYKFGGGTNPTANNFVRFVNPPLTKAPCTGPGQNDLRCLSAYFVKTVDTAGGGDLGGDDRGVLVIKFTN